MAPGLWWRWGTSRRTPVRVRPPGLHPGLDLARNGPPTRQASWESQAFSESKAITHRAVGIWFLVAAGRRCQALMASRSLIQFVFPSHPRTAHCPGSSLPDASGLTLVNDASPAGLPEPLPCGPLPLLTPELEEVTFLFTRVGLSSRRRTCVHTHRRAHCRGLADQSGAADREA